MPCHVSDLGLLSRAQRGIHAGELGLINLNPLPNGREASLGTRKTARERPTTAAAVVDYGYEILYQQRQEVFFLFGVYNLTHHLDEDVITLIL